MGSMADNADALKRIAVAMIGPGESLSDMINAEQNGCFVICNGWPDNLAAQQQDIILESTDLMRADATDEQFDALMERAQKVGAVSAAVTARCLERCPGAYLSFEDGDYVEDQDGHQTLMPCPIKDMLARLALKEQS